jgi:hypothetical protein
MGIENIRLISPRERRVDDVRYHLWAKFLAISPSYRMAQKLVQGEMTAKDLPTNFTDIDQVIRVYQDFGDVYAADLSDWWREKSFPLFGVSLSEMNLKVLTVMQAGEQVREEDMQEVFDVYFGRTRPEMGDPLTLLVSIPLDMNRRTIMRTLSEMITFYKANRDDREELAELPAPRYAILDNKARMAALQQARQVVLARAQSPRMPLWQIGRDLNINRHYADELTVEGFGKKVSDTAKSVLASTVSRFTRQALCVAENAARGRFADNSTFPTHAKEFNFNELAERLSTGKTVV